MGQPASQSVSCNVDENNLTGQKKGEKRRISLKIKTTKVSPEPGQQQLVHSSAASFFLSPVGFCLFGVFFFGRCFWQTRKKCRNVFQMPAPPRNGERMKGGRGKRGWWQECRRVGQMKREICTKGRHLQVEGLILYYSYCFGDY